VGAAGSLSAAAAGALNIAGPAKVAPGSRYLAHGDSVAFGYMEPTVKPAPDYHRASNFLGYPEQLGSELGLNVANAACPGETSASLLNVKAQSNGCENTPGGANTCTAGLLTQLPKSTCGVHPSYPGQALLAQALLKVIRL
jgi:hypothetical protein